MDIVIRGVRILTQDRHGTEHNEADIVVRNRRIATIGPNAGAHAAPDTRIVDGRGKLAMPGLINGHFHSPMNLIKGALDDLPLELYMLYEVPPLAETRGGCPLCADEKPRPAALECTEKSRSRRSSSVSATSARVTRAGVPSLKTDGGSSNVASVTSSR